MRVAKLLLFACFSLFISFPVQAKIILVPGDFSTMQGGVDVSPGSDQSGPAGTDVQVEFYITNEGIGADTFDLDISDSLGWTIVPTYYEVPLDSGGVDTVSFTVSIPYVPIGIVDKLTLTAVSQADSAVTDTAYLMVTCNAHLEAVQVTAGENVSGLAICGIGWYVGFTGTIENTGAVVDSYYLGAESIKGWYIPWPQYRETLVPGGWQPRYFEIWIPCVPVGTVDSVNIYAVSRTNPHVYDCDTLTVTCDGYWEDLDLLAGYDVSGLSNSQVNARFYVQNNRPAADYCSLTISDSLGWDIQPMYYKFRLNTGQQDSVLFDVTIPDVPVGTANRITLHSVSLSNPFVIDSASLLVTCESHVVTMTDISDIGDDQGKQVQIDWSSFPGSDPLITDFTIFRRIDPLLLASSDIDPQKSVFGSDPPGSWEIIATYPASGETVYSATVATLKDSTIVEGIYWSAFFIRAETDTPTIYFDSPIDSGYSVDNLSPSPPTNLLARHKPAVTELTWMKCMDIDFDYYTLYRDSTSEFEPSPDNRLEYVTDSVFIDSTAQLGKEYYYLVSATDFSGNESDPSNEAMGIRYIMGDANASGETDIVDIVYMVNYLFRSGSPPTPLESCDVNCDAEATISDAVYLINYLFKSGPAPCE